jgi:hypothetical protein
MTDAEVWLLAYCIVWTLVGHWYVLRRWDVWQKHRRRSKAAQKAAATRKMNGQGRPKQPPKPKTPKKPRAKKPKPALQDKVVTTESAWFTLEDEEDAPDYNEADLSAEWHPEVRRFDGTAKEYAARDQESEQ